ncbi:hypothetical protein JRC42_24670 (plasmid) [Escherichia albertii]|uniref:hypothetical protein n=1 Tax=Escherichia albertii TaxID=208962 RepID=UPI001958DF3A|nr:hypothetical protein [Escherichia albertii]QST30886.1 hypothetical protein JRC42_24670 [Escherichia albertii]QST40199.1 hypothetical protein JRC46_24520 [Escherichia albertii]
MKFIECVIILLVIMYAPYSRSETVKELSSKAKIAIPVTLINIRATCDLFFTELDGGPGNYSYFLGPLEPGKVQTHAAFKAVVQCRNATGSENVNTALVASVRKGRVEFNGVRMLVDEKWDANAPVLWLREDEKDIVFDGKTIFCKGNGLSYKECTLTPFTRTQENSARGEVSAAVVFSVIYV